MKDTTAILPNGREFAFWEQETVYTRELHVDCRATPSDLCDGSCAHPFTAIGDAAKVATPKTRVYIHAGVYRECVSPGAGGDAPDAMISYEAYGDGDVVVKASVAAHTFEKSTGWNISRSNQCMKVWAVALDPEQYKGYNPFCAINMPHDREYVSYAHIDMNACLNRRGMVFMDGQPLRQVSLYRHMADSDGTYWVEENGLTVHFRLKGDALPEDHCIELSCREQCFVPKAPFLSYIRVKGITFAHASMGAPVPQKGAVSCNRGHHWIIEDCVIDWTNAIGIDCGNQCWNRTREAGQILGNTIVRRNTIRDAGICGIAAMNSHNLLIEDNLITGAGWQGMELAWESAGIKLHGAIDGLLRRNIVRDGYRCDSLWLDYENKNTRVTCNLFLGGAEMREHVFLECNRDADNSFDNNIIWGVGGRYDKGQAAPAIGGDDWHSEVDEALVNGYGIYMEGNDQSLIVNNLIGDCASTGIYGKAVAFRVTAGRGGTNWDNAILNNLFYACGEAALKLPTQHNTVDGNAYVKMRKVGGYLRVIYPAPTMCLEINTWRRFFGFDVNGSLEKMEITVDAEQLTMAIEAHDDVTPRSCDGKAQTHCDFYGNEVAGPRAVGPFAALAKGSNVFSIDPRKLI